MAYIAADDIMKAKEMDLMTYNMFATTWGVSYLMDTYKIDNVQAATYTGLMMIGMAVSSVLCPALSDLLKSRKLIFFLISVESIITWSMVIFGQEIIAARGLIGAVMIAMGATQGIIVVFFSGLREINDPGTAGMAVGGPNMIGMAGSAVIPVITGAFIDEYLAMGITGGLLYRKAFLLCLGLHIVALIVTFFIKETHCKNIYGQK